MRNIIGLVRFFSLVIFDICNVSLLYVLLLAGLNLSLTQSPDDSTIQNFVEDYVNEYVGKYAVLMFIICIDQVDIL